MIVAVFSDVHANLPALEAFVKQTRRWADAYVCLGDVVDYGPWNDECLELVYSLPRLIFLEGNHERLFAGAESVEREMPLVREFFQHSIRYFSRYDLIAELSKAYSLGSFICTHTVADKRIYADTPVQVTHDLMIGHSHHQYMVRRSGHTIVNPGSVGQNRRTIEVSNYALYNTTSGEMTLCAQPYPFSQFISELKARRYPKRCIDYYRNKAS